MVGVLILQLFSNSLKTGIDPLTLSLKVASSVGLSDLTTVVYNLPTYDILRVNDISIGSGLGLLSTNIFPVVSSTFPSNLAKFN